MGDRQGDRQGYRQRHRQGYRQGYQNQKFHSPGFKLNPIIQQQNIFILVIKISAASSVRTAQGNIRTHQPGASMTLQKYPYFSLYSFICGLHI